MEDDIKLDAPVRAEDIMDVFSTWFLAWVVYAIYC